MNRHHARSINSTTSASTSKALRLSLVAAFVACAATTANAQTVRAWGKNNDGTGQCNIPAALGPTATVAGGLYHSLGVKADGSVLAWGLNANGQCNVPAGLTGVTAVAGGSYHSMALRVNGAVICWGAGTTTFNATNGGLGEEYGQSIVPVAAQSGMVAISGGARHSIALSSAGRVVAWGSNTSGQLNAPANVYSAIAAGGAHNLAIKASDNTVVAWGSNSQGQATVPATLGSVISISAGSSHSVAIRSDHTFVGWGNNSFGQAVNPPTPLVNPIAVSAGYLHTVVLQGDGTVRAWGFNVNGQCNVPTDLSHVCAIRSGGYHVLAVVAPQPTVTLVSTTPTTCNGANGAIDITTTNAISVAWTGPSGFASSATDLSGISAGLYHVVVTGEGATTVELDVPVAATPDTTNPVITSYTASLSAAASGTTCSATVPDFTSSVVATDNCAVASITQSRAAGSSVSGLGAHPITITVRDAAGNEATAAANLDVTGEVLTYYQDFDCDAYGNSAVHLDSCSLPMGYARDGGDCDDHNFFANPSEDEKCNNFDDDCDGENNEGLPHQNYYVDADSDSFGSSADTMPVSSCEPVPGRVTNNSDCDDTRLLYADNDGDTHGAGAAVACGVSSSDDCNDSDNTIYPGAVENCANLAVDNDCDQDTSADEAIDSTNYYVDGDSDGFGAGSATKSCSPIAGSVTNNSDCDDAAVMYADNDGDGHGAGAMVACNGVSSSDDCNDGDNTVYPGAVENCANLAVDNDCDGDTSADEAVDSTNYYVDGDSDGFGAGSATKSCSPIAGSVTNNSDCDDAAILYADNDGDTHGAGAAVACGVSSSDDCNDSDNTIYPGAVENCANLAVDNDCDGDTSADEAVDSTSYYVDGDQDGFGAGEATKSCSPIAGSVTNNSDCDDAAVIYADNDGDGHGAGPMVACNGVSSSDDCNDGDNTVYPGAVESCANLAVDNDCDGDTSADEAVDSTSYYVDGDQDGFGAGAATKSCSPIAGSVTNNSDCDDAAVMYADNDGDGHGAGAMVACNGVSSSDDCNDSDNTIYPGAVENCANLAVDNDCDGDTSADEAVDSTSYYVDGDQDGFGAGEVIKSCSPIAGSVTNNSDCDDAAVMYADNDGDGHGAGPMVACNGVSSSDDCNDGDNTVYPGAVENCANLAVDNDCDGDTSADEAVDSTSYYVDGDQDGFGAGEATKSCSPIAGSVTNNSDCDDAAVMYADNDGDGHGAGPMVACNGVSSSDDCNDADASIYPGAVENCANLAVDNDCDGDTSADEAVDSTSYYVDGDQDGFGAGEATKSCSQIAGSVTNNSDCDDAAVIYADNDGDGHGAGPMVACNGVNSSDDCNDSDNTVYPGAVENCANLAVDNDCDGDTSADEAVDSTSYYVDGDQDGFGAGEATKSCSPIAGSVTNNSDCDDAAILYADNDGDGHGAGPMVACNGVSSSDDCNDGDNTVYPGAVENCANLAVDNDCDGDTSADEAIDSTSYYVDGDGDGFGAGRATKSCSPIAGSVTNNSDCDDAAVMYADNDGDGHGAGAMVACNGVSSSDDCNDGDNTVYPGAVENCANLAVDNDCDGDTSADEAVDSINYYRDGDGDGFGAGRATKSCSPIAGSVTNDSDCDDTVVTYADNDADGFGAGPMIPCGRVTNNADCNDAAILYADIDGDGHGAGSPAACGVPSNDDNCPTTPERIDPATWYADVDHDGAGDCSSPQQACDQPTNFVSTCGDACPTDSNKTSAGTCGCGTPDTDSNGNGIADCQDIQLFLTPSSTAVCEGQVLRIRVSSTWPSNSPTYLLTGIQLAMHFDARLIHLDPLDPNAIVPVEGGPFARQMSERVDYVDTDHDGVADLGTIRYAVVIDETQTGMTAAADLVDLTFTLVPGTSVCAATDLVTFEPVGPFVTRFAKIQDNAPGVLVPLTTNLEPERLDYLPPFFSTLPANITVATDAGSTYGGYVPQPEVTAADNCDGDTAVTLSILLPNGSTITSWPTDSMFPIGVSTVTWSTHDIAGHPCTASRTITVGNYQLLDAAITFEGWMAGNSTRSLRVIADTTSVVTSVSLTGRTGTAAGIQVPVAAGYSCLSAKDPVHSLTGIDSAPFILDRHYKASFSLLQGDSNDDDKVDIYDFSIFVLQRGAPRAVDAVSNFNADTAVNNGDFAFISLNFFKVGQSCSSPFDGSAPASTVSVKELRRQGLGQLAVADLNHDGWIDLRDIQLYLQTGGPVPATPDLPEQEQGGGW